MAEGEQAIQALCRRPSTANFVATKLVTHFVADAPPARAVARVAKVFRDSDGDLALVSRSLIELDDAWSGDLLKFRTPQDWLVAVLRALGEGKVTTALTDAAPGLLRQLRHPLWSPKAPAGFGDSMQEWADSDALLNRAELARSISGRLRGSVDPVRLLDVVDLRPGDPLRDLLSDTSISCRRAIGPGHRRSGLSVEMTMDRRAFVRTMCLGGLATFGLPVVSFATVNQPGRLVFVLLRGGFDGLAAVVPYGDPSYRSLRARSPSTKRICCRSTTRSRSHPAWRRSATCGTTMNWWCCMRWRFRIAPAAISTVRRFSRPGSIGRSAPPTGG